MKLIGTWVTVAAALTFFTFTVVATAANTKPDYGKAAKGLDLKSGEVGVVLSNGKKKVCSVNAAQYEAMESRWDTDWMTVDVDGSPVDLVVVHDANFRDIKDMLGDVKCRLVQEKHVFYLPFDAQTS